MTESKFNTFRAGGGSREYSPLRLGEDVLLLLVRDGTSRLLDLNGQFLALDGRATQDLTAALGISELESPSLNSSGTVFTPGVQETRRSGIDQNPSELIAKLEKRRLIWRNGQVDRDPQINLDLFALWFGRLGVGLHRVSNRLGLPGWIWLGLAIRCLGLGRTMRAAVDASSNPPGHLGLESLPSEWQSRRAALILSAARSWWPVSCKEKAIAAFLRARGEGFQPQLVLGIDLFPFRAHLWCECAGEILSDPPDECREFQVAAVWPPTASAP